MIASRAGLIGQVGIGGIPAGLPPLGLLIPHFAARYRARVGALIDDFDQCSQDFD
jgi:hypothetical protein